MFDPAGRLVEDVIEMAQAAFDTGYHHRTVSSQMARVEAFLAKIQITNSGNLGRRWLRTVDGGVFTSAAQKAKHMVMLKTRVHVRRS